MVTSNVTSCIHHTCVVVWFFAISLSTSMISNVQSGSYDNIWRIASIKSFVERRYAYRMKLVGFVMIRRPITSVWVVVSGSSLAQSSNQRCACANATVGKWRGRCFVYRQPTSWPCIFSRYYHSQLNISTRSSSFLACNSKIAQRHTSTSSSTEGGSEPNLLLRGA